jgi:hypothetical protein
MNGANTRQPTRQILISLAVGIPILVGAFLAILFFAIYGVLGRSDGHVCGLAAVQQSPTAIGLLGTPIVQKGLTGGTTRTMNGLLVERMTFNVAGPLGGASIIAEGYRSSLESHLLVALRQDDRTQTIYEGPFDCRELHMQTR